MEPRWMTNCGQPIFHLSTRSMNIWVLYIFLGLVWIIFSFIQCDCDTMNSGSKKLAFSKLSSLLLLLGWYNAEVNIITLFMIEHEKTSQLKITFLLIEVQYSETEEIHCKCWKGRTFVLIILMFWLLWYKIQNIRSS